MSFISIFHNYMDRNIIVALSFFHIYIYTHTKLRFFVTNLILNVFSLLIYG